MCPVLQHYNNAWMNKTKRIDWRRQNKMGHGKPAGKVSEWLFYRAVVRMCVEYP